MKKEILFIRWIIQWTVLFFLGVFKTYCWIHGTFTLPDQLAGNSSSFVIFFRVLGPPLRKKINFYIWGVGYKNRVKRGYGVHFRRNFWKIFKNENFVLKFGTPSTKYFFCLLWLYVVMLLVLLLWLYWSICCCCGFRTCSYSLWCLCCSFFYK